MCQETLARMLNEVSWVSQPHPREITVTGQTVYRILTPTLWTLAYKGTLFVVGIF